MNNNGNISLIPKSEQARGLPRFVSFNGPKLDLTLPSKIGLGMVLLVVIIGLGLYAWKSQLNKQVKSFNAQLQQLIGQRDMALESKLKNLNAIMGVFGEVLDKHQYWSRVFEMLEKNTSSAVTFKSFDSDDAGNSIMLRGVTSGYGVLAEQIKIFENVPKITSVTASDMGLADGGGVKFALKIDFSPTLLKKQ